MRIILLSWLAYSSAYAGGFSETFAPEAQLYLDVRTTAHSDSPQDKTLIMRDRWVKSQCAPLLILTALGMPILCRTHEAPTAGGMIAGAVTLVGLGTIVLSNNFAPKYFLGDRPLRFQSGKLRKFAKGLMKERKFEGIPIRHVDLLFASNEQEDFDDQRRAWPIVEDIRLELWHPYQNRTVFLVSEIFNLPR